jgi:glyoxylase-like metal-dependent hydrolase (beta-lactamase superfamily II)
MAVRSEQQPAEDEVTEVAPGILRMQLPISMPGLGHVNCYVLEDGEGFTLVDPGLPDEVSRDALAERLARQAIPLERVHTVVVTHSHPDHFGGAQWLREVGGADIVTHRAFRLYWEPEPDAPDAETLAALEDDGHAAIPTAPWDRPTPWGGERYRPLDDAAEQRMRQMMTDPLQRPRPTVRLDDAQVVTLARREWVALHTPGHTHDHLCLYDPTEGVLLSGDHVLPTITPHIAGIGTQDDPLREFFASLDKVATLPGVCHVLPAHGTPFAGLADRVAHIKVHHEERLERLRAASADYGRPATVNELMRHLFSERAWGPMAESETYAHLEHLRLAGEARTEWHDGLLRFTVEPALADR